MLFRTEFESFHSNFPIDHTSKIISVGSCFSTHMAGLLGKYKFNVFNNPYGTVYNPVSIIESLKFPAECFTDLSLKRDDRWVNFLSHSDINAGSLKDLESQLQRRSYEVKEAIANASHIILTFGSAKVYERLDSENRIVANCHKQAASGFNERYLRVSEIVTVFDAVMTSIKEQNPRVKCILSVSPVRYLSDGLNKNQYGKAILRVACEEIVSKYREVEYFPAYEIMMDDLRDYRFYEADMIHPNRLAIDYIWGIFSRSYFTSETQLLIGKIEKIIKSIEHRPFNSENPAYRKMLRKNLEAIENLPYNLDFSKEIEIITKNLEA